MNGGEKDFMKDTFCKSDGDNRIFFEIFPSLPHKMWNTQIYRLFILKKKKVTVFFNKPNLGFSPVLNKINLLTSGCGKGN